MKTKIKKYVQAYKARFDEISSEELYKWQAVKKFQDTWNPEAEDFAEMLEESLSKTNNLMDSNNYYPKKAITLNAKKTPKKVKELFLKLYDENKDLKERIINFKKEIEIINSKNLPNTNHYQDDRACLVYLSLRYPERYFFYKFRMFKKAIEIFAYPYSIKKGAIENVFEFLSFAELIRNEIIQDNELLKLHKNRIGENEYMDYSYHILTQDFIYACTKSLQNVSIPSVSLKYELQYEEFKSKKNKPTLEGKFVNFNDSNKRAKHIGDLGELFVMLVEIDRLKNCNLSPIHISKSGGDGQGYDILSYDDNGNRIYIEVKTTQGPFNTPFYITVNELEKSKQEKNNFYLYRVFDFDPDKNTGKIRIYKGSLEKLCINPVSFQVYPDRN